jgi:hypothetical protein
VTWLNAIALGGIAFVALPILIHMLGRAPAKTRRFPTLRFLEATRLLPSRRTRIQDPLLLILRVLVVALAAIALAGPIFSDNRSTPDRALRAVAILLDTSASVRRGGGLEAGRAAADRLAGEATSSSIVPVSRIGDAIEGAAAWLATQPGTHEIALVSDFQLGAVDSADLALLPAGTRVSAHRLPAEAPSASSTVRTVQGGTEVTARVTRTGDANEVTWTRGSGAARTSFEVLAGASEAANVALTRRASQVVGMAMGADSARAVALVFPSHPQHDALLRGSAPPSRAWQGEIVARLAAHESIDGSIQAAADREGSRLLIFAKSDVLSDTSVALQASLARAIAGPLNAAELEPRVLGDGELAALERTSENVAASATATSATESAAQRWLWVAALLLLTVEWLVRRAPRTANVTS